ncbi:MAG: phosphatase PAP2 family protein [Psychromonas sp.]
MEKIFKLSLLSSLLISSSAFSESYFTGSTNDSVVEAGDMIQILIPATGLFATWMYDDLEGAKQLTYSLGTTVLTVQGLKYVVGRNRPNNSAWNSFPSGHTAAAFSGASFLQSRYGASWGIPAYTAATFVGVSRIHGNRHYAGDVVAGAGTAFLINQFFVSPYQMEGVQFNAQKTDGGFAINVNVSNDAFDQEREVNKIQVFAKPLKHRIELGIGSNLSDSSGEAFADRYLDISDAVDEYQPFAYVNYQLSLENNNQLEIEFLPSETRRTGVVKEAFTVDGYTFNPGDEVLTAYQHWMLGSNVYKGFNSMNGFDFKVGLGMYVHRISFVAEDANTNDDTLSEEDWKAMVAGTVKGSYAITKKFSLLAKLQYHFWEDDSYQFAEAGINYAINSEWDIGLMYGYSETKLKDSVFNTEYSAELLTFTFANRF